MGAVGLQAASIFVGLQAAQAQAKVYQAQAAAYEEQKEMAKIESSQMEAERRDLLRRQIASLGTNMSAQGSPLEQAQVYWLWKMTRREWQRTILPTSNLWEWLIVVNMSLALLVLELVVKLLSWPALQKPERKQQV